MELVVNSKVHGEHTVLFDDADAGEISKYRWSIRKYSKSTYALTWVLGGHLRLHTLLTGEKEVDHVNGNGLDNRRENLRPCTHQQNTFNRRMSIRNTTGFKGVSYNKATGLYTAHIRKDGILHHLGYFSIASDAGYAYDLAAVAYFGEFSRTNLELGNYLVKE